MRWNTWILMKEKLYHVDINNEMKKCYIDYAMSVIVGRALPDVRDGLKPVHRRILLFYARIRFSIQKKDIENVQE